MTGNEDKSIHELTLIESVKTSGQGTRNWRHDGKSSLSRRKIGFTLLFILIN